MSWWEDEERRIRAASVKPAEYQLESFIDMDGQLNYHITVDWAGMLAANLREAAIGCASWELCWRWYSEQSDWEPVCGRSARQ